MKIVCVGRNYVEHIKELNNEIPSSMVLFIKPTSSISNELIKPNESCRFECELSLLIKEKRIHSVGIGLDLTLDKIQDSLKAKGLPWERAKAFKGSALFSEFVDDFQNIESLYFELKVDGVLKQKGEVGKMIHNPNKIVDECIEAFGLEDGDIIMSGTPKGVDYFDVGEIFEATLYENDRILVYKKWEVL